MSFLFLFSFYVHAATLHVGPGQTYSSIQPAINAAVTGDHVVIHAKPLVNGQPDPYYENLVIMDKSITLRSVNPEIKTVVDETVIDGNQSGSVIQIIGEASTNTVILGLTIQNGYAFWNDSNTTLYEPTWIPAQSNANYKNCGGGISVGLDCLNNISVYNCVIQNNTASVYGGGIFNVCGVIRNCTISNNSVYSVKPRSECGHAEARVGYGGGLAFCSYDSFKGIIGCTIEGNTALGGGGLYMCCVIKQCQIIDNTTVHISQHCYEECGGHDEATNSGDGAGAWQCHHIDDCLIQGNSVDPSTGNIPYAVGGGLFECFDVKNSEIIGNHSHLFGGGVCGTTSNGINIENCVIAYNTLSSINNPNAPEVKSMGGGVSEAGVIKNCIITQNSAQKGGGAKSSCIYNSVISSNSASIMGGGIHWAGTDEISGGDGSIIQNCIISGNIAPTGGAASLGYGTSSKIFNCTIVGNTSGAVSANSGSTLDMRNCIVWDNSPSDYIPAPTATSIQNSCFTPNSGTQGVNLVACNPNFLQPGYWDTQDNWMEGDYHLTSNSTCCIDAGINYTVDKNPDYQYSDQLDSDFDGNPRIVDSPLVSSNGAVADIGAYEFMDGPVLIYQQDPDGYSFPQPMGTLYNGAAYVDGGHTRMALELDGIDDYCEITDWNGVGSSDGRLCSAWIQTTDSNCGIIMSWGNNLAGQKWMFRVGTTGKLEVAVWDGCLRGATTINDGKWHHVAAVLNGDTNNDYETKLDDILLYVDGVQETTTWYNGNPVINTATTQTVKLGVQVDNGNQYSHFDGLIDDLRIYLCTSAYSPVDMANRIKALVDAKCHWTLNESTGLYAHDSSANRYRGVLYNFEDNREAPALSAEKWQQGILGNALYFDGFNDYIEIPEFKGIDGNKPRTCSAWIKTSLTGVDNPIATWGYPDNGQKWMFRVGLTGKLEVGVWGGYARGTTTINDDKWHHVAAVYNGTTALNGVQLYVDGVLESTSFPVGTPTINTATTQTVKIGARIDPTITPSAAYFNGHLDDVRIYDRAISIDEIKGLADAALAHWKLDSTSGTRAVDSTSNCLHGTVENVTPTWITGKIGGALSLNGSYGYVNIPYTGMTGTQSRTCAGWIKTTYANADNIILSWGYAATGQKWMLRVGETGKLEAGVWGGAVRGTTTINDGYWHHVAVVLEDDGYPTIDEVKLYVDGVLQTTTCFNYADFPPLVNTIVSSTESMKIGARIDPTITPSAAYFNGSLDDMRIYEYALTPERISSLAGM